MLQPFEILISVLNSRENLLHFRQVFAYQYIMSCLLLEASLSIIQLQHVSIQSADNGLVSRIHFIVEQTHTNEYSHNSHNIQQVSLRVLQVILFSLENEEYRFFSMDGACHGCKIENYLRHLPLTQILVSSLALGLANNIQIELIT